MLNIYIVENISKKDNKNLISLLPVFLQSQINKYTNNELINMKVTSYYLLFQKLNELFGIKEDEFKYGTFNKPYLKNNPNTFFNISHTKNTVVVAISDSKVGVDVMDYGKCIDEVVQYSFHDNEKNALNSALDRNKEFVKIWANKEAYLKYTGRGINSKMKELDTTKFTIPTKCFDNYLISYYTKEKEANFIIVDKLK